MNGKKLCLIGVLALVIFGCILAAGCTSSNTSSESILGSWGDLNSEYGVGVVSVTTFMAGGNGKEYCIYPSGEKETYYFNWKQTGENTYHVSYMDGEEWEVKFIGNDKPLEWKKIITEDEHPVQILKSTRNENGKEYLFETSLYSGNVGNSKVTYPDGKVENHNLTWEKTNPNVYVFTYDNGESFEVTLSEEDNLHIWKKIDYSAEPIIGTHAGSDGDNTSNVTFNANGTGKEIQKDSKGNTIEYNFLWSKTDTNTYRIIYGSDSINVIWAVTYNPTDKSLTWKRENMQWIDNYLNEKKHETEYLVFADMKGISTEYDADGNAQSFQSKWVQTGENTYMVYYSDSDVWVATYHPDTYSFTWEQLTTEDYGND